jgi:hypothetical protein
MTRPGRHRQPAAGPWSRWRAAAWLRSGRPASGGPTRLARAAAAIWGAAAAMAATALGLPVVVGVASAWAVATVILGCGTPRPGRRAAQVRARSASLTGLTWGDLEDRAHGTAPAR